MIATSRSVPPPMCTVAAPKPDRASSYGRLARTGDIARQRTHATRLDVGLPASGPLVRLEGKKRRGEQCRPPRAGGCSTASPALLTLWIRRWGRGVGGLAAVTEAARPSQCHARGCVAGRRVGRGDGRAANLRACGFALGPAPHSTGPCGDGRLSAPACPRDETCEPGPEQNHRTGLRHRLWHHSAPP